MIRQAIRLPVGTGRAYHRLHKKRIADMVGCVRLSDDTVASAADMRIDKQWDGNVLQTAVVNQSDHPLKIKEVVLFSGETPFPPDTPFYGEGYQMLCQYEGMLASPRLIGAYGTDCDFFHFPRTSFHRNVWTVYNLLLLSLHRAENVLLAFTSCFRFSGEFRFRGSYLEIVMDTEDMALEPGETWGMEQFAIFVGADRNRLLDELAAALNGNHPPLRRGEIPSAWRSFCLRPMTADKVYENARAMVSRIPELRRIQIDGGYEAHNGDWLKTRPSLGADMQTMCDTIRATGAEAAGYISPFIVSVHSDLFREHPDWLVQDESGKPFNEVGSRREWYMLDGSHPEAQSYLRRIARVMHDEWGIRYFKLDFIAYGAFPGGVRFNRKATKVEAFRQGMKAIVDEVGHDSFVLGCNAPLWPLLGLVHGNRATNDAYRGWKHVRNNAKELFGRNWQHDALWYNDPDTVFLEKTDLISDDDGSPEPCTLTDTEFEYHKAYIVASGGLVVSGDHLNTMSDHNVAVLKKMLPPAGKAARFDDASCQIGRIRLEDRDMICIFNREDYAVDVDVRLDGSYRIYDFWSEEELGVHRHQFRLPQMEPHGARVLVCRPVSA